MNKKPIRAACILLRDGEILLIHRVRGKEEYFVFPGGGVEKGEAINEAVLRELKEEASVEADIDRLLYIHDYGSSQQYYYLCQYLSGEPKLSDDCNEKKEMEEKEDDFYEPVWMKISKLPKLLLYPLEIRDWLIEDLKKRFQKKPRIAKLKIEELRGSR